MGEEVAVVAFGQNVVFPRSPDCPFGVADVARIVFRYDLVVVCAVAVVTFAVDHVRDDTAVHEGVVVEVSLRVDAIEAGREGVGVEICNLGNAGRGINSPIAKVPVVVAARVVCVDAVVCTHDLNAGIADVVVVDVPVAGNHAVRVLAAGGRDGRGGHESEAEESGGDQNQLAQGSWLLLFWFGCERSKCFAPTA